MGEGRHKESCLQGRRFALSRSGSRPEMNVQRVALDVRSLDERVIVRTVDCFVPRVCSITRLPHVKPCGALDSELHLITRRGKPKQIVLGLIISSHLDECRRREAAELAVAVRGVSHVADSGVRDFLSNLVVPEQAAYAPDESESMPLTHRRHPRVRRIEVFLIKSVINTGHSAIDPARWEERARSGRGSTKNNK